MKTYSKIALIATLTLFLFSATSCVVLVPKGHHDNGKHKGWYKKGNNNQKHYYNKPKGKHKKH
jgi:hypothetical protein